MGFRFINAILVNVVVCFVGVVTNSFAQQGSWQKIAPVGESFTILMPTHAVEASRIIPLNDKDSVRERVYSSLTAGRRYMVVAFMKTSPDKVPALSSFDNFMLGIEQSLKSSEGEMKKSLTFDRDLSDESGIVRQYHLKVGEYPGVARFLGTDKAFYAVIVIGAEESDPEVQRFLSSFALGEPNTNNQLSGVIVDIPTNSAELERVRSALPPEPWPRNGSPIIGGVLNGKAVTLPVPEYPEAARKAHDSGTVAVQIVIDEAGNVVWAEASEGPSSLREAAVSAAWKARFTPTRLMGQPVKVTGRILYNFVR
jgi:TonB family protein